MKSEPYFSSDISEFLSLLSKNKVRFLIVGGEAVIFYGYARLTGDIDVFYENSIDNVKRLFEVLNKFWDDDIPGIKSYKELQKKGIVIQFGIPPNRIDLLNSIDGVSFGHAWADRVEVSLYHKRKKFPASYIGIDALIMNKKEVKRHKDIDDLRFLTHVKQGKKR